MNTLSQKSLFVRAMMVLLVTLVSVTAKAETKSWALWCESNKTLYFVRDTKTYKPNIKFDGVRITQVWNIADKNETQKTSDGKKAQWVASDRNGCKKVVFDKSFSAARPRNCKDWFKKFAKLEAIEGLEYLNTSEVTSMSSMFYGCKSLASIDISKFDTQKVKDMNYMFYGCSSLTELDLSNFDTEDVTDMNSMFKGCSSLTTLDLTSFNTQNVKDMSNMFDGCSSLETLDISMFDAGSVTDISNMFNGCKALETLDMSDFNATYLKKMTNLFKGCTALKTLDMSGFNVGKLKSLSGLFMGCSALTTLDLTNFDTQNINNMSSIFQGCSSLTDLDLTSFDTQNVTNMNSMFQGCSSLTALDLTSIHNRYQEKKKPKMNHMFGGCSSLVSIFIDNEKWKSDKKGGVKMFEGCNSLVGQDGTTIAVCPNIDKNGLQYAHAGAVGLMKLKKGNVLNGTNVEFYVEENRVFSAEKGETVKVKVNVPEGNTLTNLTAKRRETDVELHDDGNNTFYFTMPEGPVTVTPTFSKLYSLSGEGVSFMVGEDAVTQVMAGVTVEFSVTVPTGQEVDEISVMQGEDNVEFTDYGDGTGQFTMPAGNVTVSATFKDIVVPVIPGTYQLTTEDEDVKFYVDNEQVTEATTGDVVHVEYKVPEGMKLRTITAMQGETPLEVSLDNDCYFEMPGGDVKVTATYVGLHKLESGTLVDEETGERENDNVDFYNELYNTITEAYTGDRVTLDIDRLAIDGGKYFAGKYVGNKVGDENEKLTILKEDAQYYFIMPDYDVTVTAVLENQETLEIDLTGDDAVDLSTVVVPDMKLGELTSLMMQWEGYLSHTESIIPTGETPFPQVFHYYYNFNGDKDPNTKVDIDDAVMTRTIPELDADGTYTIQRLDGADELGANYCAMLKSPGYPMKYKDVLMNFGKSETIYGVFLYDGLENRNTLLTYDGKTVDVGFPDRLLYRDGDWNTICLPFDLTVAGSPLDGVGVTVKTLKGASLDDEGTLTLTFTEGSETEIEAGVPYLIKWKKPAEYKPYSHEPGAVYDDLYGPFFRNVTLKNELDPVDIDELISFIGTYTTWEYTVDEPSVLLVGADSKLFYPKNYSYLSPFRAYFQLLGGIEAIDPELGGSIKAMVMDLGDETTEIEELKNSKIEELNSDVWYTLQGVPLQGKPTEKGIYICNGRKVAVQ